MPSLLGYVERFGALPRRLAFSLAALMAFYAGEEIREGALVGSRGGEEYKILDDGKVLEFFRENSGNTRPPYLSRWALLQRGRFN